MRIFIEINEKLKSNYFSYNISFDFGFKYDQDMFHQNHKENLGLRNPTSETMAM